MILVLHQGAIGDFTLTLSVVQAVRSFLTNNDSSPVPVEIIASSAMARLAAGRSVIGAYHSPEQVGLHTLFSEQGPLDERLAGMLNRARWVVSFLGGCDDRLHRRLEAHSQEQVISVDPRPTETTLADGTHITYQWASVIREQGLEIGEPTPPHIQIADIPKEVRPHTPPSKTPNIIVHPGSGGRDKCWPIEHFIALAELLKGDTCISWMLGPAECESADDRFDALRRRADAGLETLIVEPDLGKAITRIADADLYVGNDGGMTHVAAAIGIPTIAIFTTTNPAIWRPLGEHVTAIVPGTSAQPCAAITVEYVRTIIRERLRAQ